MCCLLLEFFDVCEHSTVFAIAVYVLTYAHMCVEARGQHWYLPQYSFPCPPPHIYFSLATEPEAFQFDWTGWPASPRTPPLSTFPVLGCQLHATESRRSRDLNSSPCVCASVLLTETSISLIPPLVYLSLHGQFLIKRLLIDEHSASSFCCYWMHN